MLKKYGLLIIFVLAVIIMLVARFMKDDLNGYISQQVQDQTTAEEKFNAEKYVHTHFDYIANKEDFEFTILEFKSAGCTICKQMEPEMETIRNWGETKVNVVVIQILNPDSQEMMKYFGIAAVPTHLILDKSGKEFFRKYGFIPAGELKNNILANQKLQN